MKTERFGDLNVCVCGGTDGSGGGDGPLVVLSHGFGAPGTDLVGLARVIPVERSVRFAFPAAPIALSAMGFMDDARAWWEIDMMRLQMQLMTGNVERLLEEVPDGLAEARAKLVATVEALEKSLGVPQDKVFIGGFSQGAMLSCDVMLRTSRPFAGLVLLSGSMIAQREWLPLMPARAKIPVFQSHGTHDPILPYRAAERLRDALTEAGLSVQFTAFRGQHEIPMPVLDRLGKWLSDPR
jgi:phospholipase/carboxylesterase